MVLRLGKFRAWRWMLRRLGHRTWFHHQLGAWATTHGPCRGSVQLGPGWVEEGWRSRV